ncbi:hypothetical protein ANCCEY_05251 [Ancylostoma ceylanicum]|uniref:Protein kinase domain-containing protein n=1 Tax=Ancylostoma ceylanicum TaxID=53326 RepID=A0A0D6LUB2_9BILA|nr:hypothetical protein ANCCEY_05251 [Ancylostoma ceylanicum]
MLVSFNPVLNFPKTTALNLKTRRVRWVRPCPQTVSSISMTETNRKDLDINPYMGKVEGSEVERELELCATVKHPHICELCDVIAGDNYIHLVFEFLEGADICFEIVKRAGNGFVYSEAVISKGQI